MFEKILNIGRKIIPKTVFEFFQPVYHYLLAFIGALIYWFPSKKITVIGVTGTKGKTTASNLIAHVLNEAGYKTGLSTTVNFKIGQKEWENKYKQTMVGRFRLQKLLSQMVEAGCKYAVIETSSEGIAQFRHKFVDYDIAVFLNLSPEHLERHKGFENYKGAKLELFKKVSKKKNGVGVYDLDDEHANDFIKPQIAKKYGYKVNSQIDKNISEKLLETLKISDIKLSPQNSKFKANDFDYEIPLIGEFNVKNAAAAICVAKSQNIKKEIIAKAFLSFKPVSGRMETINKGQGFSIIVDYAHEPKSLEAVYKAASETGLKQSGGKLICVLGAAGGGRDKWKRKVMGEIAANYCDQIILTNEDPYDEDPQKIIANIKEGISKENFYKVTEIIDRKEAIKHALSLAKAGDAVILTGKGGEMWMCVKNGEKIPWNEKEIIENFL